MKATRFAWVLSAFAMVMPSLLLSQGKESAIPRFKVGVVERAFKPAEPYNWRGAKTHALITTIWYPAISTVTEQPQWIGSSESPFASAGKAAEEAELAAMPKQFPLIVLSHGTGASSDMMAWLGTELAANGYIAAAVNHPGNNSREPYATQGFGLWWERAKDLSAVINEMLADHVFGERINSRRIGAAGFSLGGFTTIVIAGGITDPSLYRNFCKSSSADGMCVPPIEFPKLEEKLAALAKSDKQVQASLRHATDSYRDSRVRAAFAMAPALGPAFRPESLQNISIPVEIVAGDADAIVPVATSARFFVQHIRNAKLNLLPGIGHYTFLAVCGDLGRKVRPDLCVDASGVDRDLVHTEVATMALEFFAANLR